MCAGELALQVYNLRILNADQDADQDAQGQMPRNLDNVQDARPVSS